MRDPDIEFVSIEHRDKGMIRALFVNGELQLCTTYDEDFDYEDVLHTLEIKFESTNYDSMSEVPRATQDAVREWLKEGS